jgi:hypothetical protein
MTDNFNSQADSLLERFGQDSSDVHVELRQLGQNQNNVRFLVIPAEARIQSRVSRDGPRIEPHRR